MSTQDKAVCKHCKMMVAVRGDGNLRIHRPPLRPGSRDRKRESCPGSHQAAGTIAEFGGV